MMPKAIYEAALLLTMADKPVSPEAVLAALDADDPARKTEPEKQSPDQRRPAGRLAPHGNRYDDSRRIRVGDRRPAGCGG